MGNPSPYIFPPDNNANQPFQQYSGANTRPLPQQNTQQTGSDYTAQNGKGQSSAEAEQWRISNKNLAHPASYKEYTPFGQSEQRSSRQNRKQSPSFRLPLQHLLLAAGIGMLYASLTQPWGYGEKGNLITLSKTLVQAGTIDAAAFTVLAALLMLLHSRMGCFAMLGCLGLFLLPILGIMTIGSIVIYTQLHAVPVITEANALKPAYRGLYLCLGGIVIIAIGLLLETLTRRKKGFLSLP